MLLKKKIPVGFVLNKIKFEILAITIFSVIVGFLDQRFIFISIPLTIPAILGTSISLLLAFRTNQAYDRWWEARIVWGAIVNNSRNFIRELQIFCKDDALKPEIISKFVKIQIAWVYALGETLRGEKSDATIKKYLPIEDYETVLQQQNIPNAILDLHGREIKKIRENALINEFQELRLDETLTKLCDSMGMCERIKNTVFPRTYSLVLHFLIYAFAALLPFGLTDYPMFIEESLNIIISSIFFLIENTAIYQQDPFEAKPTDVSVTAIARNIEINLLEMTGCKDIPASIKAQSYYLM